MSTRIGRIVKKIITHRPVGFRPETPDAAAHDADEEEMRPPSSTTQETALAKAPRGPFKILTIPQAWYNSLHADHGADDDTGKNE